MVSPGAAPVRSRHGFDHPSFRRRRHCCRSRSGLATPRRTARGRRAEQPAGHRRVTADAQRRSDHAHGLPSRHDAFVAGVAVRRMDVVGVVPYPRRACGGCAGTLVLDIPVRVTRASVAGCLHRLRHAAAVAAAGPARDVVESFHHRPGLQSLPDRAMCSSVVRTRTTARATRADGGSRVVHWLPGFIAGGKVESRARSRTRAGNARPPGCAAVLGANAVQHPAVARGGDDF